MIYFTNFRAGKDQKPEKRKFTDSSTQNKFNSFTKQPTSKKVKKFDDNDCEIFDGKIPDTDDNTGKVANGIVSFDQDECFKKQVKGKAVYHSSSEDDVEVDKKDATEKSSKKNRIDIHSSEHKKKLRQRFLEKQKLTQSSDNKPFKEVKEKKNNKYYEGSSDEEDEAKEEIPNENVNKTSTDVLKTFKSFSNVWQDTDEETDDSDSDSDPSSTDQNEVSEVEEEQSEEKRAEIKRKLQKTTEKVENRNESKLQMTRYDPAADDQDQFLRKEPEPLDQNVNQKDAAETMTKKFEIKTDLKQAFNSENTSGGFSFGFLGEHDAENENEVKQNDLVADYDSDQEEIVKKPKVDLAAKFGMKLKGKGVSKSNKTFFFTPEDPRLEEGVSWFFDHEVDVDDIRTKYNEKRPILAEILKKRLRNKQKRMEGSSKKQKAWSGGKGKVRKNFNRSKRK